MNRILVLGTAAMLAPAQVAAQTNAAVPTDATPPGEIIVTGQKQETTLQDADASVTVLDAKAIDDARIRDFSQLDDVVPNVQFNQGGQLSNIFITIRGVESNPFIVNRAAVYIDGIPFRELTNAVLSQVESIEVLRGPQGTLYGANSESGLILLRTRLPSDKTEGEVRATGSLYSGTGSYSVDGYFSQPLTSKLAASLSVMVSHEPTWIRNRAPGVKSGVINERFAHARLRWQPDDLTTVNATAYVLDINAPGVFDQDFYPQDRDLYDTLYSGFNGGQTSGRYGYFHEAPARTDETETVLGLSATREVGSGNLDAAISWRKHDSVAAGLDFDFTALPVLSGRDANFDRVFHAEIRYASDRNRPLSLLVGTSYIRDAHDNQKAIFQGPGTLGSYVAAPLQERSIESVSGFGVVRWKPKFLPDTTLSAGLRYDRTRQSAIQRDGQLDLGGGTILYYTDNRPKASDEAVLPRFSVSWEPDANATLFATVAKGYIPGGFNLAAAQEGITDPNVLRYGQETMWSYEIGFHLRSADGRLRGSGAIFQINSNNWQEIRILTDASGRPVSSDFIGSSARVRSRGFEVETSWNPIDALTIAASFGYADATYRYLFNGTTNLAGNRVKLVPEYDGHISARYQHPSGLFARAAANFVGAMALDEEAHGLQGATATFDLQLGYEKGMWTARLFGENLTNTRRISGLAFDNLAFGRDGTVYGGLEAPRILGIELERRF
jgi:iron complex outermembrane receptor protein